MTSAGTAGAHGISTLAPPVRTTTVRGLACDVPFKNAHDPQFKYQFTVGSEQYEAHYRPHMIGAKTFPADGPRTLPIVVSRRR